MSATVIINRLTGVYSAPTYHNVTSTNVRVNADDVNSTNSTSDPIAIPFSGDAYSFWFCLQLEVTVNATSDTINNLKFFSSGSDTVGTGCTLVGNGATTYIQATGVVGTSGDQLTTAAYTTLYATPVDYSTFSVGSSLALAGTTSTVAKVGDFVVLQYVVDSTASPGSTVQQLLYFQFDES